MRLSRFLTVAVFAGTFTAVACNSSTATAAAGTVSVQVLDANNAGVQLVNVDLYKGVSGSGILWRSGITSSNGIAVLGQSSGIEDGSYYVHISFISNYSLAATETNDKPVTLQGGGNVTVIFHVVASAPGR